LKQGGFVEGQSVDIDFRWADGKYDLLDGLASDLVKSNVKLIATTGGTLSAKAAKRATEGTSIPILFVTGRDPVKVGLVASFDKPGGNATGVTVDCAALVNDRLERVLQVAPKATTIAVLVHPDTEIAQMEEDAMATEARKAARQVIALKARRHTDFAAEFGKFKKNHGAVLLVQADPYFHTHRDQIVALANQLKVPTIYPWKEYAEAGGLMSYSPSLAQAYRRIGLYAASILKGNKAAELPVLPPNSFELTINLKTAKAIGIEIPQSLLAKADTILE
jgi:putative ABC transport system substrate-binding protein